MNHFRNLAHFIAQHEKMEETQWYPFLLGTPTLPARVRAAIRRREKEERAAGAMLQKLKRRTLSPSSWMTRFMKFYTAVLTHAQREEEQVLPWSAQLWTKDAQDMVARQMIAFKQQHY